MEDNTKKLTRIFIIVIIIVFIITLICLISSFKQTNQYGYEPVTKAPQKTTTKVIDDSYTTASNEVKVAYNTELLKTENLLPLNNILINKIDLDGINLIQSDESKFIYVFTKLDKESLTLEEINNEVFSTFEYEIDSNNISKYLNGENYTYEINKDISYCFKLNKIKENETKIYLNIDILQYNEEKCSQDVLNYDSIKEGLLILSKNEDKYSIDSFALIKEEN